MYPIKVSYRDFEKSDAVTAAIEERAEKLEEFFHHIISCDVIVSSPHKHHEKGRIFHIQVRVHVPGADVIINRDPERDANHEDIYLSIRDAFDSVERKLQALAEKRREH